MVDPAVFIFLAMTRPKAHAWYSIPRGNEAAGVLDMGRQLRLSGVIRRAPGTSRGNSYTRSQDFDALRRQHNEAFCNGEMMVAAVEAREVEFIRWHLMHCPKNEASWLLPLAAAHGARDVWKHFQSKKVDEQIVQRAIIEAVTKGSRLVIYWFHNNMQVNWTTDAMDQAAKHGRLDVVKWLHKNRAEGCTKKAMDGAVEGGHYKVVKWLCENRTEGCSSSALVNAMTNGRRDIVALLLEHVESLQNWPEPHHTKVLVELIERSNVEVYQDVVRHRKKLYKRNSVKYPEIDAPSTEAEKFKFVRPIVSEVTARLSSKLRPHDGCVEIGNIITNFVMDPLKYTTALEDGDVAWLSHFSEHPNEDALQLAKRGNLKGARTLHQNLSKCERLRCRKQFLWVTMEARDINFIKWHVRECPGHAMDEWLYAATRVGREDVILWLKENWCTVDQILRNPRDVAIFPNSLEESLSRVEEEFVNALSTVKKQMSGLEQAAWSGKLKDVRAYLKNNVNSSTNSRISLPSTENFQLLNFSLTKASLVQ